MNKVSVIIVNYNGETVLEGCLDAVLASFSDVPIEIIVIESVMRKFSNQQQDGIKRTIKSVISQHVRSISQKLNLTREE